MRRRTREVLAKLRSSIEYWLAVARHEFTDDLDRIMREEGLTQSELAERMETSQAYISKALGGESNFTIQSMVKLARGVGATLHIRLTRSDEVIDIRKIGAESRTNVFATSSPGSTMTRLATPSRVASTAFKGQVIRSMEMPESMRSAIDATSFPRADFPSSGSMPSDLEMPKTTREVLLQ